MNFVLSILNDLGATQANPAGLVFFVVLGIAILVVIKRLSSKFTFFKPPYIRKSALLSSAETKFLRALRQAIGRDFEIFSKVRIADVLDVPTFFNKQKQRTAFNKIAAKHLDYVLCDKNFNIICAIELDDRSHELKERKKRDEFVDRACTAAKLPIVHIKLAHYYDYKGLRDRIYAAINN